jgi:hypothetical protein
MILHKYRSNGMVSGKCAGHKSLLIIMSLNTFLKAFLVELSVRAVIESWNVTYWHSLSVIGCLKNGRGSAL